MEDQLTPDIEARLRDKSWRMDHFYKITNINAELVRFKRNAAQRDFNANRHNRNIILKSRRLGFTTDEAMDMIDDCMFTPNFHALMLSYDIPSQLDIFDTKIRVAWENMSKEIVQNLKVNTDRANELQFMFPNGARSSLQVRSKGRSGTFQRVHVSEFGKIAKADPKKAREIVSGTLQAVPMNGRVDIESTAEGDVGRFHDMFWEAWDRGEPRSPIQYKAFFYNWQWDEAELDKITQVDVDIPVEFRKYQEEHNARVANPKNEGDKRKEHITDLQLTYWYYKWLSLGRDWHLLKQEYPTTPEEAFTTSGVKLFDMEKLSEQATYAGKEIGGWTYYDEFVPGHSYAVGADPAEGVGQDLSAAVVIDFSYRDPLSKRIIPKVVAEFANNTIQPDMFAHELSNIGKGFGNCLIAVERNNYCGGATLTKLKDIYHNIFTEIREDKVNDTITEKLGWNTNKATKPHMLYELSTAVNNLDILIPSGEVLGEMRSYDKEDLSRLTFDPEQPSHWDRLMALAICYQMLTEAIPTEIKRDADEVESEEHLAEEARDPMDRHDSISPIS